MASTTTDEAVRGMLCPPHDGPYALTCDRKKDATRAWIKEAGRMRHLRHSRAVGVVLPTKYPFPHL